MPTEHGVCVRHLARYSRPHTENQPQAPGSRMRKAPIISLHKIGQRNAITEVHKGQLGHRRTAFLGVLTLMHPDYKGRQSLGSGAQGPVAEFHFPVPPVVTSGKSLSLAASASSHGKWGQKQPHLIGLLSGGNETTFVEMMCGTWSMKSIK